MVWKTIPRTVREVRNGCGGATSKHWSILIGCSHRSLSMACTFGYQGFGTGVWGYMYLINSNWAPAHLARLGLFTVHLSCDVTDSQFTCRATVELSGAELGNRRVCVISPTDTSEASCGSGAAPMEVQVMEVSGPDQLPRRTHHHRTSPTFPGQPPGPYGRRCREHGKTQPTLYVSSPFPC